NPQYAQPRPFACERIIPMPAIRVVALLAAAVAGSAAAQTPAWQDLSLPFERRAADLVGRMTLEEKVSQMMDRAPAIERLGIPEYNWWNEGLQGEDPRYLKTIATVKHFAVHSGPEPLRHQFDAVVSERDLRESYLPHFEAGIREAGAYSLMCAYNRVFGAPACGSDLLLRNILRGEWRFPGYVVSDCGAIDDVYQRHRVAPPAAAAAALGVRTGTDLDCGREYANLVDAVHQGLISEQAIDTAVTRLFGARFRLGMFDPPAAVRWAQIPISVLDQPSH